MMENKNKGMILNRKEEDEHTPDLDVKNEEQIVKPKDSQAISDEVGIIAKDTRVEGDIITAGSLAVYGDVIGNIDARGDIIVAGRVDGSVKCSNLNLDGCKIKADLIVKKSVMLENNASLDGQIDCQSLSVDGQIKGNITAGEEVTIYKGSSVTGDIKAKTLGIEPGAQISGNISVVK